uniref:Putative ovule protein n=2 Tax=Solanum chacoense TaxID=4108 RepID=A0A0V0H6W6_SOLCH
MISFTHRNLSSSYLPIQINQNMIQEKHYLGPHLTFTVHPFEKILVHQMHQNFDKHYLGLLTRLNPSSHHPKDPYKSQIVKSTYIQTQNMIQDTVTQYEGSGCYTKILFLHSVGIFPLRSITLNNLE